MLACWKAEVTNSTYAQAETEEKIPDCSVSHLTNPIERGPASVFPSTYLFFPFVDYKTNHLYFPGSVVISVYSSVVRRPSPAGWLSPRLSHTVPVRCCLSDIPLKTRLGYKSKMIAHLAGSKHWLLAESLAKVAARGLSK